jgi:methylaspartate ammonia-lyase
MHLRLVGASWCGCVNPHTGAESGGVHSSQCVPVGTPDGGGVCQSAHRTRALTVPMVRTGEGGGCNEVSFHNTPVVVL